MFSNKWIPPYKHYDSWDTAPVKFHKFLVYFWLPFSIIVGGIEFYILFKYYPILLIIPTLTYLAVVLVAWTNLLSKEWLGYRLLILYLILGAVLQIVQIIITGPDSNTIAQCIGDCLPYIILLLIVHSYYDKRRLLFSPLPEIVETKNKDEKVLDNIQKAIPTKKDENSRPKSQLLFYIAIVLVIASIVISVICAFTVNPASEPKKPEQDAPKIGIMQQYQYEKQQEAYLAELEAAREAYQESQEGQ